MTRLQLRRLFLVVSVSACLAASGCDKLTITRSKSVEQVPTPWLGLPSAINQVHLFLHDVTGGVLSDKDITLHKSSEVRSVDSTSEEHVADFLISVHFSGETFETTAIDVPCDKDGIPTEAAVAYLRDAVNEIKAKLKQFLIDQTSRRTK